MWRGLFAIASGEMKAEAERTARRIATLVAAAVVAGVLLLFALAGVLIALFFWMVPDHGPVVAALLTASLAFLFAVIIMAGVKLASPAPRRPAARLAPAFSEAQTSNPLVLALGALALGLLFGRSL